MKKIIALALFMVFVLGLSGCAGKTYELPWDRFCYAVEPSQTVELSGKERSYIIDLMNRASWMDDVSDCACDYIFYTQKQEVRYHSACGTFTDVTNRRCMTVSEEQRIALNEVLKNASGAENGAVLNFKAESVKELKVSTLPQSDNYKRTVSSTEGISRIVDYINELPLKSEFSENPDEYVGMVIVMEFCFTDGTALEVYAFGRFLRIGDGPWLRMEYEEADMLEDLVLHQNAG